jgi:hypothetical protein
VSLIGKYETYGQNLTGLREDDQWRVIYDGKCGRNMIFSFNILKKEFRQ